MFRVGIWATDLKKENFSEHVSSHPEISRVPLILGNYSLQSSRWSSSVRYWLDDARWLWSTKVPS